LSQGNAALAQSRLDSCPVNLRGWEWGRLLFLAQRGSGDGPPSFELGIQKVSGLPISGSHYTMNPNGFLFVIHSQTGEAKVLSVTNGKPDFRYYDNGKPYRSVAIASDGKSALMLRATGEILYSPPEGMSKVVQLATHDNAVAVALSPDLRRAASVDSEGELKIWHMPSGAELFSQPTGTKNAIAMEFSAQGNKIALYDADGNASLIQALSLNVPNQSSASK